MTTATRKAEDALLNALLELSPADDPRDAPGELEQLQALLLTSERQHTATLEARIAAIEAQLAESQALLALLSPVLGDAIARCVRESRDEVAEALYPVIGRSVMRAVHEAMRELAQRIDTTMRRSLQPRFVRHLALRLRGVDPRSATLRAVLPFTVQQLFLVHRASGLLIQHLGANETIADADMIGGMLAAIRAYVQDSFSPSAQGSLDAIGYGELHIVIEDGSSALLAAVVQGVEPAHFRNTVRQQLSALHAACGPQLRAFCGDPIEPRLLLPALQPLLENAHDAA